MTTVKKLWKQFGGLVTAFRNSTAADIFTTARIKITLLYLTMGMLILGVAGYLIYSHTLTIIQSIIGIITQLLKNQVPVNEGLATNLIVQSVNAEIQKMNLSIGLWVLFTLIISAYVFAGITLRPIRMTMEKQKRFIANVSHELRTPLAVMKTSTEVIMLDAETLSREELIDALKSNLEEVNRMARITQFLLDFSNLENRLSRMGFSRVDLGTLVQNMLKLVEKTAATKDVKIVAKQEGPTMVNGNPVALEEMVLNLLKNAVSYTPTGGVISVIVARRGFERYGRVILSIRDTGVGIARQDLPKLFEPFFRGKNAPQKSNQSMGLGLAIVREIADLHHATISIKSDLGKGTTVSVRFSSAG